MMQIKITSLQLCDNKLGIEKDLKTMNQHKSPQLRQYA